MDMLVQCYPGLSMGMGFPWEGIARIAFPVNDNECQNDNKL